MWKRNLITRSVAIVPSLIVALVAGDSGADDLIVWSQVLLSIQLPFALIPLLKMTSSHKIMGDTYLNGKKLKIVGWLIGILIIVANVLLVGYSVMDYLDLNTWLGWIILAIEVDIGVFYVLSLAYISYTPVDDNSKPPLILEYSSYEEELEEMGENDNFDVTDDLEILSSNKDPSSDDD